MIQVEIQPSRISDLIFGTSFEGVMRFWLVFFGQIARYAHNHPLRTAALRSSAPRHARGLPLSLALPDSSPYQGEPFWDGLCRSKRLAAHPTIRPAKAGQLPPQGEEAFYAQFIVLNEGAFLSRASRA